MIALVAVERDRLCFINVRTAGCDDDIGRHVRGRIAAKTKLPSNERAEPASVAVPLEGRGRFSPPGGVARGPRTVALWPQGTRNVLR